MSKKNTKKQTGLKIVRNGDKFICSWSTRETYKKQKMEFVYRANKKTKTKKPDISAGTKKKIVKLDLDDLKNLSFVRLRLQALANKKDWSAWAVKEFEIEDPNRPSVDMALSNLSNVSVFSWGTKWSKTGHKPFDHVHIQTLKADYMKDNPNNTKAEFDEIPDSSWEDVKRMVSGKQTTEFPASGTREFTEDSSKFVGDYSYTRVVRARSEGAGGYSNWNYAWHVYARARAAVNISAVATLNRANNTFECTAEWSSESTPQHPIDEVQPQYAKAKPETGMTAPDDANWVDIPVQRDTTDMDAVTFSIDGLLAKDQCVFFRVKTYHDNVATESIPVLATGNGTGDLKDPTGLRIEADDTTHRARVYATNASEVEDSFIVIYYIQNNYDAWVPCGIIPFDSSYVDVQCDNWSDNMPYSFGARTVVASWASETGSDNISRVKIFDRKMQSEQFITLAGVTAPIPPNNVTADQADPKTILVKWQWEWGDADGAEVSWSDYENAWDSTQEPETHIVKKIRQSQLYITDLEAGIDWYVRVRYFKGEEGEETYSPYSKQEIIRLTTVPTVPQLTLSPTTIAQSGSVEASWVYVASEDDEQQSAQVVEIVGNTEVPLASVTAEQKVTIPAKTDNREWETGTTHVLAVRVKNTKGQSSPLSNYASVMIADPLEASIENTNLEQETIETGAEVKTGSLVTLNGGDETNVRDVTSLQVSLEPVQDNKYDSVWSGGNGKNKLPITKATTTSGGVTYTIDDKKTQISVTGTPTANTAFAFADDFTLPAGTYIVSKGFSASNPQLNLYSPAAGTNIAIAGATETTFTLSEATTIRPFVYCFANMATGVTFYPMIRKRTESADFEPYENICPITGHDSVGANVTGKNLLENIATTQTINGVTFTKNSDGTITANGTATAQIALVVGTMALEQEKSYRFNGMPNGSSSSTYFLNIAPSPTTGSSDTNYYQESAVNPVSDMIVTVRIYIRNGQTVSNLVFAPMIRFATETDAAYEPYTGSTYTATLPQTVYGGNAELVGGTGRSTLGALDLGDLTWTRHGTYTNCYQANANDYPVPPRRAEGYNGLCSAYNVWFTGNAIPVASMTSTYNNGTIFISPSAWGSSNYLIINDTRGLTAEELKAELAGQKLVFELPEPTDLTFTPQSITLNEGTNYVWSEQGDVTIRTVEGYEDVLALKELPLRFSVTGTSPTSVTNVVVKRAENFEKDRPNGDEFRGYKGEVIYSNEYTGAVVDEEITLEDVIAFGGSFDDTAEYSLEATLKDNLGQVYPTNVLGQDADGEDITSFVVDWTKQATEPSGIVRIEDDVAKIKPTADSAYNDDYCNIYRLSADKPVLIAERCTFGETYVDPYPAIGTYGYRIVLYTANGDYTKDKSEHDEYAWEDIPATYESDYQLIDFADRRITLSRNVDLTNTFTKDFQQTKYLGGAIQGDWNKGVGHSAGIASVAVTLIDQDDIDAIRELGWYEGQAHVRTKDGACYTADIQVSDSTGHDKGGLVKSYNFSITRVESQELDGVLEKDWEED